MWNWTKVWNQSTIQFSIHSKIHRIIIIAKKKYEHWVFQLHLIATVNLFEINIWHYTPDDALLIQLQIKTEKKNYHHYENHTRITLARVIDKLRVKIVQKVKRLDYGTNPQQQQRQQRHQPDVFIFIRSKNVITTQTPYWIFNVVFFLSLLHSYTRLFAVSAAAAAAVYSHQIHWTDSKLRLKVIVFLVVD